MLKSLITIGKKYCTGFTKCNHLLMKSMKNKNIRLFFIVLTVVLICDTNYMIFAESRLNALSPFVKVTKPVLPDMQKSESLIVEGAIGEIVSGQVLFTDEETIGSAELSISTLRHEFKAFQITESNVKLYWERYIDIDRNSKNFPDDELVVKAPASIPDPYWEFRAIPLNPGCHPIWLEISIPYEAVAGDYSGELTVSYNGKKAKLPVKLHVWNFTIPEERHLSVINWWRFPGVTVKDSIETFSEEYWNLLESYSSFVVQHRQTDVDTSFSLIIEHGDSLKGYTYDTSKLEQYAEIVFKSGIRRIHMREVGQRTEYILDPLSRIVPREDNFRKLAILQKVIEKKGWKNRFLVSIVDEPFIHHEETFAALVDRVHETAPDVWCIEAVEAEYLGKLDIYVPKLSHLNLWYPRFDKVRNEGAELWFYICNHPFGRYPNRQLDLPLIKVRVLHWINYLYDLQGYLHWALNCYGNDKPYTQEGISLNLPLGERAIAYPVSTGLIGSLRASTLRDGLEDYEYLWLLEDRIRKIKESVGKDAFWVDPRQRPLELCRRVIWSFHDYTRDPEVLENTRLAIAEEIESLDTDPLLIVQTSPSEGITVPAGPRNICVRGLTNPGAEVFLNGEKVKNVRPSGYFLSYYFMPDDNPEILIEASYDGKKKTARRTFILTD